MNLRGIYVLQRVLFKTLLSYSDLYSCTIFVTYSTINTGKEMHVAIIFEQQTMYNVYSYVNQDLNISVPGA